MLLAGCVYYNGMYNTNRLAKSARKAERDGRPSEAQGLWGQVVTRADSLIVRHPRSKYADQASVIRGLALARLNQCPDAVGPLGRLDNVELSPDLREEAALALGRCQLELGDAQQADLAFTRVINSADSARRREARYRHARALRMSGRFEEALPLLRESRDPRGRDDLLLSLAGTGQVKEALAVADSIMALHDSSIVWDSVVAALGRQDPRAASALVTRIGDDPGAAPEFHARRLYDDAVRLEPVDSAAANARYLQVARMSGATESATRARLHLVRQLMGGARTLEDLRPLGDSLGILGRQTSSAAAEAMALASETVRVRQLADSGRPDVPQGDLRLFLGAEAARDSLGRRCSRRRCSGAWRTTGPRRPMHPRRCSRPSSSTRSTSRSSGLGSTACTRTARTSRCCGGKTRRGTASSRTRSRPLPPVNRGQTPVGPARSRGPGKTWYPSAASDAPRSRAKRRRPIDVTSSSERRRERPLPDRSRSPVPESPASRRRHGRVRA
jgi:tetratricopeptide (TPR) repeat protein